MPFLEWREENKTNVKICDDQHKKLFDLVNHLYEAMRTGKGKEVMGKILNDLINYTVYHFSTEEKLMEGCSYPGLVWHKKEHEELAQRARELKEKFDKSEFVMSIEVMNFLKDWLNKHTIGSDRKYGEFLNSKGVF